MCKSEEVINVFQVIASSISIIGKKYGIDISLKIILKLIKKIIISKYKREEINII